MSQLGVQFQNLHVQDKKLVIRGHAKTKADSNKVWDQIKLVDQNYQQISWPRSPMPPRHRRRSRRCFKHSHRQGRR